MSIADSVQIVLAIIAFVSLVVVPAILSGRRIAATRDGAASAVERLADWAKWMAGLQTATLASLGLMTKGSPPPRVRFAVIATVMLMGLALFCSAYVLSSLAQIALAITAVSRDHPEPDPVFDIYEQPIYGGFRTGADGDDRIAVGGAVVELRMPTLNYMVTLQHWLWGMGLIAFGIFLLETMG